MEAGDRAWRARQQPPGRNPGAGLAPPSPDGRRAQNGAVVLVGCAHAGSRIFAIISSTVST
jgi:hypothetical protein